MRDATLDWKWEIESWYLVGFTSRSFFYLEAFSRCLNSNSRGMSFGNLTSQAQNFHPNSSGKRHFQITNTKGQNFPLIWFPLCSRSKINAFWFFKIWKSLSGHRLWGMATFFKFWFMSHAWVLDMRFAYKMNQNFTRNFIMINFFKSTY